MHELIELASCRKVPIRNPGKNSLSEKGLSHIIFLAFRLRDDESARTLHVCEHGSHSKPLEKTFVWGLEILHAPIAFRSIFN